MQKKEKEIKWDASQKRVEKTNLLQRTNASVGGGYSGASREPTFAAPPPRSANIAGYPRRQPCEGREHKERLAGLDCLG
ncbi:hypothetical protein AAE478_001109 [Parahypoxylon ruwenzoriense]